MSNMEEIHHGSTGSGASKLADHFEMENPHETDSSQYVDEPGCVPIENDPVQTAPPLKAPTRPVTSHPVTAPVTQTTNMVQVSPGPSNFPVVPSASTIQYQATLQVPIVFTKPIMGPVTGQFLVKRLANTNNLVVIPPTEFMLKTTGTPVITNQQQKQIAAENTKQGQRRTLSPVAIKGPEPKKARIIQNVQSGPAGPMNSRGQKNNPTMAPVHVPPPAESSNRFDISRYQPVRALENNFQEEDDVTEEIPQILGQNVSEPNSQWGSDESMFDLVLVPEPEFELGCCDDKINHDDVHGNQYLVSEEHAPVLNEREVFDIIHDLGDSHRQEKVSMKSKYYFCWCPSDRWLRWYDIRNICV